MPVFLKFFNARLEFGKGSKQSSNCLGITKLLHALDRCEMCFHFWKSNEREGGTLQIWTGRQNLWNIWLYWKERSFWSLSANVSQ